MNIATAERTARNLMDQHGLTDWSIDWSRAKKTHGLCSYRTRTLTFSRYAFERIGDDEVMDTILHEIAHALAGAVAGHGYQWKRVFKQIGGSGRQYVSETAAAVIKESAPWIATCPNCGKTTAMHRAPLRIKACGDCCRGRFNPAYIMQWKHNGTRACLSSMPVRYRQEAVSMNSRYGVKF